MAHSKIILIGSVDDLDWIYENKTTDSSSESSAEQAFGYDYISPVIPCDDCKNGIYWKSGEVLYTIGNKESEGYKRLLHLFYNNYDYDVWDLRCRENYHFINFDIVEKRYKTKKEVFDFILSLPNDTTFFFADVHL